MKIIGKTENGLLIAASANEIANLIGFYYTGETGCPQLVPGMELKVSEMYHQLRNLADGKDKLAKTAAELRNIADLLELKNPIVAAALKPDTQS